MGSTAFAAATATPQPPNTPLARFLGRLLDPIHGGESRLEARSLGTELCKPDIHLDSEFLNTLPEIMTYIETQRPGDGAAIVLMSVNQLCKALDPATNADLIAQASSLGASRLKKAAHSFSTFSLASTLDAYRPENFPPLILDYAARMPAGVERKEALDVFYLVLPRIDDRQNEKMVSLLLSQIWHQNATYDAAERQRALEAAWDIVAGSDWNFVDAFEAAYDGMKIMDKGKVMNEAQRKDRATQCLLTVETTKGMQRCFTNAQSLRNTGDPVLKQIGVEIMRGMVPLRMDPVHGAAVSAEHCWRLAKDVPEALQEGWERIDALIESGQFLIAGWLACDVIVSPPQPSMRVAAWGKLQKLLPLLAEQNGSIQVPGVLEKIIKNKPNMPGEIYDWAVQESASYEEAARARVTPAAVSPADFARFVAERAPQPA